MRLQAFILITLLFNSVYATEWGYDKHNGPKEWSNLNEDYKLCGSAGTIQSPINIQSSAATATKNELKLNYQLNSADIINNRHSLQMNFSEEGNITFEGKSYDIVQLHFHSPSENKIDNKEYPLEMHAVHQDKQGKLLVIGVLFKQGNANKGIQAIIDNLPEKVDEAIDIKDFNIYSLFPKSLSYYAFKGSLTTPPCSEDVQWIILKQPMTASKQQIEELGAILHHNVRDIQPLNNREIKSAK